MMSFFSHPRSNSVPQRRQLMNELEQDLYFLVKDVVPVGKTLQIFILSLMNFKVVE